MSNVNRDGIVTPDENTRVELDVILAAMADSISAGIGDRLRAQETFIGAYLNADKPFTTTAGPAPHPLKPIPFGLFDPNVTFAEGMDTAGGYITCPLEGLYNVSVSTLFYRHSQQGYLELTLHRNGARHGQVVSYDPGDERAVGLALNTVMRCVPGDRIWASVTQYFGDYSTPPTMNVDYALFNTISVTLVQAF